MRLLKIKVGLIYSLFITSVILELVKSTEFAHKHNTLYSLIGLIQLCISLFFALYYVIKHSRNMYIVYWIGIFLLLTICYRVAKAREILDIFIYSSLISEIDQDTFVDGMMEVLFIGSVAIIGFALIGIIPHGTIIMRNEIARYSFGFNHPNVCSYILLTLSNVLFVKYYDRPQLRVLIIQFILGSVMVWGTHSRMCIGLLFFSMIIYAFRYISKNIKKQNWKINSRIIGAALMVVAFAGIPISLYAAQNYNTGIIAQIDRIITSRFFHAKAFVDQYPITFLGNRNLPDFVENIYGWGEVYLDNGYLVLILKYGLINTLFYLGLLSKKMFFALKYKNYKLFYPLLAIIASLYMEQSTLQWLFAFALLLNSNPGMDKAYKVIEYGNKESRNFDIICF